MKTDNNITIDEQYSTLLTTILDYGKVKKDRTGTGTKSIFGYTIRHKMSEGFPLLTTKKMPFKIIVTELLWFLNGSTNIKYLVDNGCNIWNGDAFKNYCNIAGSYEEPDYDVHIDDPIENRVRLMTMQEFVNRIKIDNEFAKTWGELGPIYGAQWRSWRSETLVKLNFKDPISGEDVYTDGVKEIDQIKNLIEQLKTNPDSRRLMVSAWNVGELSEMLLPPCHYGFQIYTTELTIAERRMAYAGRLRKSIHYTEHLSIDELDNFSVPKRKISLLWNQRSADVFLGLPFNIASYGLLLQMLADEVNMVADELIGSLGDVHLYLNHIEQAKEQISRHAFKLPTVSIQDGMFSSSPADFRLSSYQSHETIKAPLSN
jgi:thymidylate synthase